MPKKKKTNINNFFPFSLEKKKKFHIKKKQIKLIKRKKKNFYLTVFLIKTKNIRTHSKEQEKKRKWKPRNSLFAPFASILTNSRSVLLRHPPSSPAVTLSATTAATNFTRA